MLTNEEPILKVAGSGNVIVSNSQLLLENECSKCLIKLVIFIITITNCVVNSKSHISKMQACNCEGTLSLKRGKQQ